jgi:ABC-type nickel/cobalt efflux system permease component RcnA
MAMAIPSAIRQRGFAKWYERELMIGHGHLVLLLLSTLAALGALEAFQRPGSERLLMAFSLLAAAGIGAWALRRYLFHLMRAEAIANQAVCPRCHTYARFDVEAADAAEAGGDAMAVCCRACGHRWRIEW